MKRVKLVRQVYEEDLDGLTIGREYDVVDFQEETGCVYVYDDGECINTIHPGEYEVVS